MSGSVGCFDVQPGCELFGGDDRSRLYCIGAGALPGVDV